MAQANVHTERMLEEVARKSGRKPTARLYDEAEWDVSARVAPTEESASPVPAAATREERVRKLMEEFHELRDEIAPNTSPQERAMLRRVGSTGQVEVMLTKQPCVSLGAAVAIAIVAGMLVGVSMNASSNKAHRMRASCMRNLFG